MSYQEQMSYKIVILTALFYVRHQGGSEVLEDFFTFAKKHVDKIHRDNQLVYHSEMASALVEPKLI